MPLADHAAIFDPECPLQHHPPVEEMRVGGNLRLPVLLRGIHLVEMEGMWLLLHPDIDA
ncbi:hypothetical protein D3C86_1966560 [compost metagenome]